MVRELGEQRGLEHELRLALEGREVGVHSQPIVALGTAAIVGVEVLARWTSPARGEVPPDRFIPVAESSGLIVQLGEFVLREACLQTAQWLRTGLLPDRFVTWVNVSGRQLTAEGLGAT